MLRRSVREKEASLKSPPAPSRNRLDCAGCSADSNLDDLVDGFCRTHARTHGGAAGSPVDIGTALQWQCSMTAGENDTCLHL